jgi:hypothetical protein
MNKFVKFFWELSKNTFKKVNKPSVWTGVSTLILLWLATDPKLWAFINCDPMSSLGGPGPTGPKPPRK